MQGERAYGASGHETAAAKRRDPCGLHRHDPFRASAQTIAAAGIPLGALALTREYTKSLLALGYRLPAHGADVVMLGNLVRHTAEWRQAEN